MTSPSPRRLQLVHGHPEHTYRVAAVDGPEMVEQRLLAMGFVRGSQVRLLKRTLGRQTLAVSVDGIAMLLRAEEAARIAVFPLVERHSPRHRSDLAGE